MPNTILRKGPSGVNNTNVSAPSRVTAAATRPGTFVKIDSSGKYAVAATADVGTELLFVTKNNALRGESVQTEVAANTTIGAFQSIQDGRVLAVRAAAGTYTAGQKLQLTAAGIVTNQTGSNGIVAYVEAGTTITAAQVTANTNYLDVSPA